MQLDRIVKLVVLGSWASVSLLTNSCAREISSYQSSGSRVAASNTNQQAGRADDQMPSGIFDEHSEGAKEAWRRFTGNGRYRVARTEDFSIPAAAIRDADLRHDINRAIAFAYVAEDINRDGIGGDRAFIVLDTTRTDAAKYGLVIFNGSEDERKIPEPHWVYREQDLSRTVMFWARGELTLHTYCDDGTFSLCHIKWDEKHNEYSCE